MSPFRCAKLERHLNAHAIADPLPEPLARHLAGCRACRSEWEALHRTDRCIAAWADEPVVPEPDGTGARAALLHRLRRETASAQPNAGQGTDSARGLACRPGSFSWGGACQLAPFGRSWKWQLAAGISALTAMTLLGIRLRPWDRLAAPARPPRIAKAPRPGSDARLALASGLPVASPGTGAAARGPRHPGSLPVTTRQQRRATPGPSTSLPARHDAPAPFRVLTAGRGAPSPSSAATASPQAEEQLTVDPTPPGPAAAGGPRGSAGGDRAAPPSRGDLAYLNAPAPLHPAADGPPDARGRPRGDDFITIPLPRIAAADSPAAGRIVADAVSRYRAEQQVVDDRLARKIDVEMKGGDLGELMGLLQQKADVRFDVQKDLQDVKLTVLAKGQPARDLMRQVARLFNLQWRRHGEEGKYRYELMQDLKQRLQEEELRRKDEDQMLLNVVNEMEPYLPYKDTPPAELKALAEEAKQKAAVAGSVEERQAWLDRQRVLSSLARDEFRDVLSLYSSLTPDQLVALRNGQPVLFTYKGDGSENTLPQDVAERLRQAFGPRFDFLNDKPESAQTIQMGFSLDRSRPDIVGLNVNWKLGVQEDEHIGNQVGLGRTLISGRPDRLRKPDNAAAHAALRGEPQLAPRVTLDPRSDNPPDAIHGPYAEQSLQRERETPGSEETPVNSADWIDSADYFARLHQKTGRSIIADYYTRVYPRALFAASGEKLFDALNAAADALRSDWQEDGAFLRFRRFDYYSERTMDVSNRLLAKWKASRDRNGHLTLDDLAEMATLPDLVLGHDALRRAVLIKYGLDEWPLASSARDALQLYAVLDPGQRQQVQSDSGLALAGLSPDQAAPFRQKLMGWGDFSFDPIPKTAIQIRLQAPGTYEWLDRGRDPATPFPIPMTVHEKTRAKAEAAVEALLKSRGEAPDRIADAQKRIEGPEAGVWMQVRVRDWIAVASSHGTSTSMSNGSPSGPRENGRTMRRQG